VAAPDAVALVAALVPVPASVGDGRAQAAHATTVATVASQRSKCFMMLLDVASS